MLADLRYALRNFRKSPGFAVVAIAVLALGIGANTAMFSVLDATLIHSLPFRDPGRVVMLWERNPSLGDFFADRLPACLQNILQWKALAHSFDSMTAFEDASLNLTGAGDPAHLDVAISAPDLPDLFGVRPALGRMFKAGEDHVAVISHQLFLDRFGGDARILGRSIELNKSAYTVIGVWPASFRLPAMWGGFDEKKPQVWIPLDMRPAQDEKAMKGRTKFVYAHLSAGVTIDQARAEMDAIGARLQKDFPDLNPGFGISVFPVAAEDVGPSQRRYVLILEGAVAFVLLIACANVANILLARSIARRREMAVRMALGASRLRLARQMLVECLLLSFAGAVAGLAIAFWGVDGIRALAPADTPHLHDVHLAPLALLFTIAAALATGFIFGLAPAFEAAQARSLHWGGRSGSGGIRRRLRGVLVAGEVAMAMVLLVGAGLLIRTVYAMLNADPGFRRDGLLSVRMNLPEWKYPTDESAAPFCRELLEKVSALPGVISASLASGLPMQNLQMTNYRLAGAPAPANPAELPSASIRGVSEDYFRTMIIPLREGRAFTRQEVDAPRSESIVINELFAEKSWPGQDPIGKAIVLNDERRVVVGVVGDARQLGPEDKTTPEIYLPAMQLRAVTIVVRSALGSSLAASIARTVHQIDPDQPIADSHTMQEITSNWIAEKRFMTTLLGAFAALALALAVAGLYGVLAYSVSQRTREIGIRIALGADGADVVKMVTREGLVMTLSGIAVGLAGALALTRVLEGLIFGVKATDPWTLAGGVLVLMAASIAASAIPARRASKVEPVEALRVE
jgi:predicted permease